jgi:hypothetical protein
VKHGERSEPEILVDNATKLHLSGHFCTLFAVLKTIKNVNLRTSKHISSEMSPGGHMYTPISHVSVQWKPPKLLIRVH